MQHSLQVALLSTDQLRARVPAAFAESPHASRSERYGFVSTGAVIQELRKEGFFPVSAMQANARKEDRALHTKHMLRFRRDDVPVDGLVPEVVLVNSHDGSSGYQLMAGLFRFVCFNGLMLSNRFETISVPHRREQVRDVIEGSFKIISEARKGLEQARAMNEVMLSHDEQRLLALSVHQERFGAASEIGHLIAPERLLEPKRPLDKRNDCFTTINRLQEHALGGGLREWDRSRRVGRRQHTMRAVSGIQQTIDLNRAIWGYGERILELKHA